VFTVHVSRDLTGLNAVLGRFQALAGAALCVASRQKAEKAKEAKEHVKAKENVYEGLFFCNCLILLSTLRLRSS